MPKPTTDFQRQRVWQAQRDRAHHGFPQLGEIDAARLLITIVKSSWFRTRLNAEYQKYNLLDVQFERMPSYTHCAVDFTPMKRRAGAKPAHVLVVKAAVGEMSLPELLHPLVHMITPTEVGTKYHHTQTFTKNLLAMIARFVGVPEKKRMQATMRKHKVKFTVVSDEAREKRSIAAKHRIVTTTAVPDLLALRDELMGS